MRTLTRERQTNYWPNPSYPDWLYKSAVFEICVDCDSFCVILKDKVRFKIFHITTLAESGSALFLRAASQTFRLVK
jgi:hypothetical protein